MRRNNTFWVTAFNPTPSIYYLDVSPKKIFHPFHLDEPFSLPIKTEIHFTEENDLCLAHSFDYANARTKSGRYLREIMQERQGVRESLLALENGLLLAAQLSLDLDSCRGEKIIVEFPAGNSLEEIHPDLRFGSPHSSRRANGLTTHKQVYGC